MDDATYPYLAPGLSAYGGSAEGYTHASTLQRIDDSFEIRPTSGHCIRQYLLRQGSHIERKDASVFAFL